MDKIYIIGDIHTVSAFRLAGVTGAICGSDGARSKYREIAARADASVILVTNDIAEGLREEIIRDVGGPGAIVIEIPGIDDDSGLHASAVRYIAGALGIAL